MQQKDLAQKMDMKPAYLSKLLAPTGNPTIETLQKMAAALKVPVSVLLREKDYITGFLEINGKGYRIETWENVKALIRLHDRVSIK